MTCVAGVVRGGMVHLGADSIAIAGYHMHTRATPKVFTVGPFVIGCAGSFRAADLMRYKFDPGPVPDDDLHRYMATSFADALRATFRDGGVSVIENNAESVEVEMLVGVRGRLFEVDDDFQVGEPIGGFGAVGIGGPIALGALYATRHDPKPRHRLTVALDAAQAFCAGVRAPYSFASIRR